MSPCPGVYFCRGCANAEIDELDRVAVDLLGSAAAAPGLRAGACAQMPNATAPARSLDPTLARFVDPLPLPAVAAPRTGARPDDPKRSCRSIASRCARFSEVHRDLPPTRLWGLRRIGRRAPCSNHAAAKGCWSSGPTSFPTKHLLPIDHTLHGAERDKPEVRSVVHLHGAKARRRATAIPRTGTSREVATRTTIRTAGGRAALVSRPCDGN